MKNVLAALLLTFCLTAFNGSEAAQLFPADPGTVKIHGLYPLNEAFTAGAGHPGFYFSTDTSIVFDGSWTCLSIPIPRIFLVFSS